MAAGRRIFGELYCWLVTIVKEIASKVPRALPEIDGKSVEAVVSTDLGHKAGMEKYKEKLLECDDKYSRACATIWLNCADGPQGCRKSA